MGNRGTKTRGDKQKTNNKMIALNQNFTIAILNISGPNTPIKSDYLALSV